MKEDLGPLFAAFRKVPYWDHIVMEPYVRRITPPEHRWQRREHIINNPIVAFADDVAVMVTGHTSFILETVTNKALEKISDWKAARAGLTLSVRKTEAVVLTTKRGY